MFKTKNKESEKFKSWSPPAALLLLVGIVLARLELSPIIILALSLGLVLVLLPKKLRWLLPLVLFLLLGYARYNIWNMQSNPITDLIINKEKQTLSGFSDGRFLKLDNGAKLVISPSDALARGRVEIEGYVFLPANKRNTGGFDYRAYLRRRGVWGQVYVKNILDFKEAKSSIKERLQAGVAKSLSEKQAALMQAIILGIRDDLGSLREVFAKSGLAHILALSGLHVGILILALGFALKPLGLRRYPILILLLIAFIYIVGPSPSILRAGAMTIAALLSLWLGSGRIELWSSLALSMIFTLLYNPSWLFDASFQLSYLAVIGLVIFTEPISKLLLGDKHASLPWWSYKKLIIASVVTSLSAQMLTLPIVASSFGTVPIFNPIVNIFAIPIALILVPLGFLAGVLGLISLPLAGLLNSITAIFASALMALAEFGSSLPLLTWGEISWLGYSLYFIGVSAFVLTALGYLKFKRALFIALVTASFSWVSALGGFSPEIVFLDVGQGDSTLIRLENRTEILIDGGGSPFSDFDVGKGIIAPALRGFGIDELELVIASHVDADHIEGLISLFDEIPVQQLVIGAIKENDPLFDALMASAKRNNVKVVQVFKGQSITIANARLDFLNPPHNFHEKDNDNSLTFVFNYQDKPKAVFMGDLPISVEKNLAFPKVDILMAGHHGSKSSTSAQILAATQPKDIVISYGRNSYGHPNGELMDRLKATGARIHETFKEGQIRLALE